MHNNPEEDLVRPLDGDNDENHVLSAFTDDDLLDKDIALPMARAPQSLTDANGKSRTDQNHVLSAFTDDDLLDKDIALPMASAPQSLTDANGKSRTDQNHVLSVFMDNDSLDNDIALAMASAPQSLTDANGKSRTGVDINQVAAKAVQAAGDDSDDDRTRQVTSFNRIHARKKRNSIGQQKTHGIGSDGVCMVEESSYLDETDVHEESVSTNHDLLHYALHVVDEEMTSFDQSDVELATDYQPQGECGSSTSEIDDQMREEPFRNSPTVHAYANTNDAHTNAQLSNYQSALAMSDAHKSQVDAGIQYLSPQEAVIVINDVNSPLQVDTGEENAAADLAIDITETEALATMQSHSVHTHARQVHTQQVHSHAHAHHQVPSPHAGGHHYHAYHESMTANTAELSSRSEETWESYFTDLGAYKEQHGNCLVSTSTELGRWLCRQRHNFRYDNLKEEQKERLVKLDKTCLDERIAELSSGTITDKDGNATSLAGMPALHVPPPRELQDDHSCVRIQT